MIKHFKLIIPFFLILNIQAAVAQIEVNEKQFELYKPMLYEANQEVFKKNDFSTETITNLNFIPDWEKKINLTVIDSLFTLIRDNILIDFEEYKEQKKELAFQNLKLIIKRKVKKFSDHAFKFEIVENNLVDKANEKVIFNNLVALVNGGAFRDDFSKGGLYFNLKKNAKASVKGTLKFKVSFLSSYKVVKVNDFLKDSIFEFQKSKFKILEFKDNYIKFVGLDSLADNRANNILELNLDKNLKTIVPLANKLDVSPIQVRTPSGRYSLPPFLFEEKVKDMTFEAYSKYLDKMRKLYKNKKINRIHLVKFDTKIDQLYFYEECYDIAKEFEVTIDQKISIKKVE